MGMQAEITIYFAVWWVRLELVWCSFTTSPVIGSLQIQPPLIAPGPRGVFYALGAGSDERQLYSQAKSLVEYSGGIIISRHKCFTGKYTTH